MENHEQELIDILFSCVITVHRYHDQFKDMTNEELAKWVSKQLNDCGFYTEPCGSSWGVLKDKPSLVNLNNMVKFVDLTKLAESVIVIENLSWKEKYDFVFENIATEIRNTDIDFSHYDPDTSYEEDVTSYVSSLKEKASQLQIILDNMKERT